MTTCFDIQKCQNEVFLAVHGIRPYLTLMVVHFLKMQDMLR